MPEWYQRRFLPGGKGEFRVLDKTPATTVRCPDGALRVIQKPRSVFPRGPHALFQREHFYAISFPRVRADYLERELFGTIDGKGCFANEMFCNWPQSNGMFFVPTGADVPEKYGHPTQRMFDLVEFIDAQKTRTPKGLAQLKLMLARRGMLSPSNNVLMGLLQDRRLLNCTVWSECIWEIFSAHDSKEKFLLSDDPVTIYNCDCYPLSNVCAYPHDPDPFWRGSRVLWPLSADALLVLTHAEHCDEPSRTKARKPRRNARSGDDVLVSYTDITNERKLTDDDVKLVNIVIKTRASRYVASAIEEQLYPEQRMKAPRWHEIDALFYPKYRSSHTSRKTVIRYKDDSLMHTNAFGEREVVPGWFVRANNVLKKGDRQD